MRVLGGTLKSYLQYVSEVLGLATVVMPAEMKVEVPHVQEPWGKPAFFYTAQGEFVEGRDFQKSRLVILNWVRSPQDSLFETSVAELFGKMLMAMKLPQDSVLVLDCVMNEKEMIANELLKVCETEWVLFFTPEPVHMGEFQIKGPMRWLETFSPAILLKEPQSKKIVWNDMQKIMKEL